MIKRLLQEVKQYKKSSILAPLFMVGEVTMELMLPFLMSFIIDKGIDQGNMAEILKYDAGMCVYLTVLRCDEWISCCVCIQRICQKLKRSDV